MADEKIRLWLKTEDEKKFKEVIPDVEWKKYSDGILTGVLEKSGYISKIEKSFVTGKRKIGFSSLGIPSEDEGYPFAHIKNSSAYRKGLMLTPYPDIEVIYHLKSYEELLGDDSVDFVERVFLTYGNSLIDKFDERDSHLVLYEVIK